MRLASCCDSMSSASYSTRISLIFKNVYPFAPVSIKALNCMVFPIELSPVKHGDVRTWKIMEIGTIGTEPGASVGLVLCRSILRSTFLTFRTAYCSLKFEIYTLTVTNMISRWCQGCDSTEWLQLLTSLHGWRKTHRVEKYKGYFAFKWFRLCTHVDVYNIAI